MVRSIFFLISLILAAAPCRAQTVDEIDKREAAVIEAWQLTPLTIRKAVFVDKKPEGFGMYEERTSNAFPAGEPLVAYAEPVGYGWRATKDGSYEFGFTVDFEIKSVKGKRLATQKDFANLTEKSHSQVREFLLTLTLNVTGADPGDYVLTYTLHDITGDKTTSFDMPFTIAR